MHKCVIRGVPHPYTDDEIKMLANAEFAARFKTMEEAQLVPTKTVLLEYAADPPAFVRLGYAQFTTHAYIPRPLQCKKCLKFGHSVKVCRSENEVCSKCSSRSHTVLSCPQTMPICLNCGGEHMADDKKCRKYQNTRQALIIRTKQGISFAEALKQTKKPIAASAESNIDARKKTTNPMAPTAPMEISIGPRKNTEVPAALIARVLSTAENGGHRASRDTRLQSKNTVEVKTTQPKTKPLPVKTNEPVLLQRQMDCQPQSVDRPCLPKKVMIDSSTQSDEPSQIEPECFTQQSVQRQAYKHVVMMAESILFLFTNVPFPLNQDGVRYVKELIAILNDLGIDTDQQQAMLDRNVLQSRYQFNQIPWAYSGPPQFTPQHWAPAQNSYQS